MAQQKNDFSKGSIPKTILSLAAPMTMAQLINVLYSVVDRMYLGRLPGHLALTGLGLTMPIISILMGFANLCGMGGAPLCSIYRGKGENEEAEYVMGNSFTLLLILGVLATAVCLLIKKPMLYLFGASDATFPYADAYLTIYLLGTIFVMVSLGLNPFINSQGFAKTGMMTVGLGAVVNIVLDPIFIFVLDLGVQGAALATILAQGCSAVWVLHFLTGKKAILRLRLSRMVLTSRRVKRILSLGLAGFFVNLTNSLVQVVCNATLQTWGGDLYVGVMTIVNSIREVVVMPLTGVSNGAQPVLGFNYGGMAGCGRASASPARWWWPTRWRPGPSSWPCPSPSSVSLPPRRPWSRRASPPCGPTSPSLCSCPFSWRASPSSPPWARPGTPSSSPSCGRPSSTPLSRWRCPSCSAPTACSWLRRPHSSWGAWPASPPCTLWSTGPWDAWRRRPACKIKCGDRKRLPEWAAVSA